VEDNALAGRGPNLDTFGGQINAAVVGANGGLGRAFAQSLIRTETVARVIALSRSDPGLESPKLAWQPIDIADENSIQSAARNVRALVDKLHLVVVASGILHDTDILQPEKTWRALNGASLEQAFRINAIGPALVGKHFLPLLARHPKSAFAVLSARVGSIADNRLGGWHSYRASKAALNMLVRTLSIELKRSNPLALCIALHPGTVDSRRFKPMCPSTNFSSQISPPIAC
jgi:NAD(P)-dependent dehydrogenase (short-subunit alcohol dehydrogenase family)